MTEIKRVDEPTGTLTVGHEWDGIEELDTPMPRWWVIAYWATIVWAIAYIILYPAIPLISGATQGIWHWSSREQLERELKGETRRRAPITNALTAIPIEQLANNERLYQAAVEGGRAAFKIHCVQCHGSGAAGAAGYPNLNDDDWLWGGDLPALYYTLSHGVRQPDHEATRFSQMPAFAGILNNKEIDAVAAYVQTLSAAAVPSAKSAAGAALFATNCATCHGGDGKGLRQFGAPNLTDKIWLYGGDITTIKATISNSRYGVMPRWDNRLDQATIKMLAAYVHALGGGEANPAPTPTKVAANVKS